MASLGCQHDYAYHDYVALSCRKHDAHSSYTRNHLKNQGMEVIRKNSIIFESVSESSSLPWNERLTQRNIKRMSRVSVLGGPKAMEDNANLCRKFPHCLVPISKNTASAPCGKRDTVSVATLRQCCSNMQIIFRTDGVNHCHPIIRIGRSTRAQIPNYQ